ncbi:MAG TPA: hypothetical protein V6C85_20060 [Allocoleopsis sp.]
MTYHAGELAVQARAGVRQDAQHLTKMIGSTMKLAAPQANAERELTSLGGMALT